MVTLPPDTVSALVAAHAPVATGEVPSVIDEVRPLLPPAPWQSSAMLDAAFTQERWRAEAYLDPASATLVLVAQGM